MKVFDILEGKEKEVEENKLVFVEKKSEDYILSIPHSGTLIPVEFIDKFNVGKFLVTGSDAYTKEVYNTKAKGQKTNIKSQKYEIDLSSQPKGIYIIKVTTSKGVAVEKVVLE